MRRTPKLSDPALNFRSCGSPARLSSSPPTDIANFLGCRHRTALDMAVAHGKHRAPRITPDPLLEVLWQRGLDHEKRYVDSLKAEGRDIVDLSAHKGESREAKATKRSRPRWAMRSMGFVVLTTEGTMGVRGDANGTSLITSPEQMITAAKAAEMDMVAMHAETAVFVDMLMRRLQRAMNRTRKIRHAAEGSFEPPSPKYPITEVGGKVGGMAGSVYAGPRELVDELEDGEFDDADGRRWRLTLLPMFELVEGE